MAWSILNLFKGKQKRVEDANAPSVRETKSDTGLSSGETKADSAQLLKEWLQSIKTEETERASVADVLPADESALPNTSPLPAEIPAAAAAPHVPDSLEASSRPLSPASEEALPSLPDRVEPEDLEARWAARRLLPRKPLDWDAEQTGPWSSAALSPAIEGISLPHSEHSQLEDAVESIGYEREIEPAGPILGPEFELTVPTEAEHHTGRDHVAESDDAANLVASAVEHELDTPLIEEAHTSEVQAVEEAVSTSAEESSAVEPGTEERSTELPNTVLPEEVLPGQTLPEQPIVQEVERPLAPAPFEGAVNGPLLRSLKPLAPRSIEEHPGGATEPYSLHLPREFAAQSSPVSPDQTLTASEGERTVDFAGAKTEEPDTETSPSVEAEAAPQIIAEETESIANHPEETPLYTQAVKQPAREPLRETHTQPASDPALRQQWSIARSQPAGPPVRFAMLHAVAKRWERPQPYPLPAKRIFVVAGAAIEARRLAPVIRMLRMRSIATGDIDDVCVCAAGEDAAAVRDSLEASGIAVDCNLSVTFPGQTLDTQRARTLNSFASMFNQVKPQWLVVAGDTLLTAMASLAAYDARIHVARIDGGTTADTGDLHPEEINRQLVDLFSSIHFTETDWSKEALVHEGVPESNILVVGNPSVDALYERCSRLGLTLGSFTARSAGVVQVLITVGHRVVPDGNISEIARAIGNLAVLVPGLYEFFWPLPVNEASAEAVHKLLARVPGIQLTPAATYDQYLRFLSECDIVLTDSVELQEEAPSLGKPVLMMGPLSRRVEAVRSGVVIPVDTDSASIQAAIRNLARKLSSRHGQITNPYGDGKASARIADFFDCVQVLEFGHTALPKLVAQPELPQLPQPVSRWRLE